MSIKLATHKHFKITGLYRVTFKKKSSFIKTLLTDGVTCCDFWDKYRNKWEPSYSVERADLIELTAEEKAAL